MDMTEYLMSVAMYSIKYAEAFKLNEDDVSNTLGYVFKFYQDDVKEYSNQELSLLVVLLSLEKKEDYNKFLKVYTLDNIKRLIKNTKEMKDILPIANKLKELYYSKDFKPLAKEINKILGD